MFIDHSPLALVYPGLVRLLDVPGFVAALQDHAWLASVDPWLRMPDYTSGEEKHWASLLEAVPSMAAYDLPSDDTLLGQGRQQVRRAAVRAIAIACGLGQPTFAQCPGLGGDPFVRAPLPSGLVIRVGRCEAVRWSAAPVPVQMTEASLRKDAQLELVERAFLPLLGASDFEREYSRWLMLSPVRAFDDRSRYPLILPGKPLPGVPQGYEQCYLAQDVEIVGVPFAVAAKIVSPYIAKCVREARACVGPEKTPKEDAMAWALNRLRVESSASLTREHVGGALA